MLFIPLFKLSINNNKIFDGIRIDIHLSFYHPCSWTS